MAVYPYTKFKGVTDINKSLLTEEIGFNLKHYVQWCLLGIGAWADVNIPTSGYYGGTFHELSSVEDPNYDDYQVWETPKKDLVYEENVNFNSQNPIDISGVYVDNSIYGTGHATYGHYIDYENGRVIFDTALAEDDTVKMNYSYRTVAVELASTSTLWKELQYGTLRVEDTHLGDKDKGEWTGVPVTQRQQMPAIIIEPVPRGNAKPWELGSQAMIVEQDVLFHIVAEDSIWRDRLIDIFRFEYDHTIWLFNSDLIVETDDWPIDYRGMKVDTGLMYPELIEAYKWLRMRFLRTVVSEVESHNRYLHEGTVRATVEIIYTKE